MTSPSLSYAALKDKIINECIFWFTMGCDELGINSDNYSLEVLFFSRGTKGGSARLRGDTGTLKFNIILAMENTSEYIEQVIPHEVAHILTTIKYGYIVRGFTKKGKAIFDSHGANWQHVMRKLGKTPTRCHDMNVSSVKVKKTIKRWIYACPSCNKEYGLTSQKHTKAMQKNCYICKVCRNTEQRLCFTGEIRSFK